MERQAAGDNKQGGEFSMIWKKCRLLANVETGEDALGNPVYALSEVKRTVARFTPWTNEQIAMEGREITRNEQQFILPIPYTQFPVCQKVEISGHVMDIKDVTDFGPRYTSIRVKAYKG